METENSNSMPESGVMRVEEVKDETDSLSDQSSGDSESETVTSANLKYKLKVWSPRTVESTEGTYTTYGICLQTRSAVFRLKKTETRRRFSEFLWLRKQLAKINNWRKPPPLSSKRFWNLFDPQFVESRRQELEQWIHAVLSEPDYLSSYAVHLFLQTEMTVPQMEDYMEGNIPEERMQEIWSNHGKLYNYQPHNLLHNNIRQEPTEIFCDEEDFRSSPSSLSSDTPRVSPHHIPLSTAPSADSHPGQDGGHNNTVSRTTEHPASQQPHASNQSSTLPSKSSSSETLQQKSVAESSSEEKPTEDVNDQQQLSDASLQQPTSENSKSTTAGPSSEGILKEDSQAGPAESCPGSSLCKEDCQTESGQRPTTRSVSRQGEPAARQDNEVIRVRSTSPDSGFCQDEQQTSSTGRGLAVRSADIAGNAPFLVGEVHSINGD